MKRLAFVWAMDAAHLAKWYGAGVRLFVGWASTANTAGKDPAKDRKAQLDWRAAVRALGPDALYVDYPLPDWHPTPAPADLALMLDDPQCYGFLGPDEPNMTPPADTTGKVWRVSLAEWSLFWYPIVAADPAGRKVRVGDFAGNKLSAAWGSYTGADAVPYVTPLTRIATSWHPRNAYGNERPDCDIYAARAVLMMGRIAPGGMPRWYVAECADEELKNANGRAPTADEMVAQYNGVMNQDSPANPIEAYGFFPQRPRPDASHIFDNTTPEQFEAVRSIIARFLPPPVVTPPPPTPLELLEVRTAQLEKRVAAFVAAVTALGKP